MREKENRMVKRYTVPTHLGVPDQILFGLTARHLLTLLLGGALSYHLWALLGVFALEQFGLWGIVSQMILSLPPMLISLLFAFVNIADRPLELWMLVVLRYHQTPKCYTWRTRGGELSSSHRFAEEEMEGGQA